MSNRSARGRTYAHIHDGGKWISELMRSISALQLGNTNVGYIVLTAQSDSFTIASPTSFAKPVNLGVLVLADPAPSSAFIRTLTRQHTDNMRVINEYHRVDKA